MREPSIHTLAPRLSRALEAERAELFVPLPPAEPGIPGIEATRELFVYWPAWREIVEYVTTCDPRTVQPQDVFGAACATDLERLACLLYGRQTGNDLEHARAILRLLLLNAREGRRPRYGCEFGLTAEDFGVTA